MKVTIENSWIDVCPQTKEELSALRDRCKTDSRKKVNLVAEYIWDGIQVIGVRIYGKESE